MKTISDYTIYCTEAQANKALKFGAQIDVAPMVGIICDEIGKSVFLDGGDLYWLPTAEQMIGWLEDGKLKKIRIDSISYEYHEEWFYSIFNIENNNVSFKRNYTSRPEATLAAIDAALEYLTQNKK